MERRVSRNRGLDCSRLTSSPCSGSVLDRQASLIHIDHIQYAEGPDIDLRRKFRIDVLPILHERPIGSIAIDLFGPRVFLQGGGRPRMFLHPGKHLIIGAAGQNHPAKRLSIQPSKGQKPSVQREPGSEDIGDIGLRELLLGKETDFIDQTGSRMYPQSDSRGDRNGTGF